MAQSQPTVEDNIDELIASVQELKRLLYAVKDRRELKAQLAYIVVLTGLIAELCDLSIVQLLTNGVKSESPHDSSV